VPGPSASVVITNYNYATYLRESIESALAQTLEGVEVVVVDDGSTDDSRSIIDSYGDRVKPVLKANGGQTSAINAGVRAASGQFVVCLDADDTVAPTALADAAGLFDGEVTRVFWRLREVGPDGEPTGRVQPDWGEPAAGDLRAVTLEQGPDAYVFPPQSGNAFARDVVEFACPLPELEHEWGTGSAHADTFLVDASGLLGSARELAEPAGTYRVHSSNDWAKLRPEAKLERLARLYGERCAQLERMCDRLGLAADPVAWRQNSWLMRTIRAKEDIDEAVPVDAPVTVIDDNAVDRAVFGDRPAMTFFEQEGSPDDERDAVQELERIRSERGGFFTALWPAFWWWQTYPHFACHLEATAACVRRTEEVRVYALDGAPT
jgi:hypothetical protein